jgi:integrase
MTGVDRLRSGKYRVRVQRGRKPVKVPLCDTPEEAVALRRAIVKEIGNGDLVPATGLSVKQWGPTWLQKHRSVKRGFKSERNLFWSRVATADLAKKPMVAISRKDVLDWLSELRRSNVKDTRRPDDKLSLGSRKHALVILRLLLQDALDEGLVKVNVAANVRIREPAPPQRNDLYLSPEQQDEALKACGNDPEKWMVAFAIGTGLRQGEHWALELSDLHVDGDNPHVLVRFGSPGKTTKSGKVRMVPLFGLGLEAALEWLKILPKYAPHNPHNLVFPTPARDPDGKDGHRNHQGGARRQSGKSPRIWSVVKSAFMPRRIWWHLLRHTAASSLVAGWWGRKWRLEEVRQFMGHSTIKVTERYAHLAQSTLHQIAVETQQGWDRQNGGGSKKLSRGCHDPTISAGNGKLGSASKPPVVRSNRTGRARLARSASTREIEPRGPRDSRALAVRRARRRRRAGLPGGLERPAR